MMGLFLGNLRALEAAASFEKLMMVIDITMAANDLQNNDPLAAVERLLETTWYKNLPQDSKQQIGETIEDIVNICSPAGMSIEECQRFLNGDTPPAASSDV
jgi:hypothetical protein